MLHLKTWKQEVVCVCVYVVRTICTFITRVWWNCNIVELSHAFVRLRNFVLSGQMIASGEYSFSIPNDWVFLFENDVYILNDFKAKWLILSIDKKSPSEFIRTEGKKPPNISIEEKRKST